MFGSPGRVGMGAGYLGHRPQAVKNPPGQPDRPGELLVDVDGVEVARCPGVTHGHEWVGSDLELDRLALLQTHPAPSPGSSAPAQLPTEPEPLGSALIRHS